MSDIFLSYIVPCYKVEGYLPKCIESLACQSIPDGEIEFIMVNDGSPDGCLDLICRFAKEDKRVVVVNQENSGVSVARNNGTRAARGKYLFYLDGDDCLDVNASRMIYDACEKEPDIVVSNAWYVYENNNDLMVEWNPCGDLSPGLYTRDAFVKSVKCLPSSFKAYKRDLVVGNDIYFDVDLKTGEVFTFFIHCLCHASNIAFIQERTLYYLQRNNSAMSSINPDNDANIFSTLNIIDHYADQLMPQLKVCDSYRTGVLSLANSFGFLKYSASSRINNSILSFLKKMKMNPVYRRLLKEIVFKCGSFDRNYVYSFLILCFPVRLAYFIFRLKNMLFKSVRHR